MNLRRMFDVQADYIRLRLARKELEDYERLSLRKPQNWRVDGAPSAAQPRTPKPERQARSACRPEAAPEAPRT